MSRIKGSDKTCWVTTFCVAAHLNLQFGITLQSGLNNWVKKFHEGISTTHEHYLNIIIQANNPDTTEHICGI